MYYSESLKQQRKAGIKCVSRCEDKEQKEIKGQNTGKLWIYTHRNQ